VSPLSGKSRKVDLIRTVCAGLLIASVFLRVNAVSAEAPKPYVTDAGQLAYARFLEREKDYKGAVREYARLIETFPKSPLVPEARFRMSEALYEAGLYGEAETAFDTFLQKYGDTSFAPEARSRLDQLRAAKSAKGLSADLHAKAPEAAPPRQAAIAGSPLSGFNPADLAGVDRAVFFEGRGFAADNAGLSVLGLLRNDWGVTAAPQSSNRALAYWNTGAGVAYKGWRVAGFYRGEFYIDANRDTVDFLAMINRRAPLPVGRVFNIDLSSNGFSAMGIEVSKGITLWKGLLAGVTARYISGGMLQFGKLTGSATPTAPNAYDFNFLLDYNYDRNIIYPRSAPSGTGNGYSFDLGLRYKASETLSAGLLLRDLAGRIYWTNTPFSTVDATSNVKSFDSSGYQQYRPTIQGFEGFRSFTQHIPFKADADVTATLGPVTVSPQLNLINGRPLYWLFLGYRPSPNTSVSAGYNANYEAWSIGAAYKKSMLSVFSSGLDPGRAPALGAALTLWWDW
jgi:tetratricopeptide repeat protein